MSVSLILLPLGLAAAGMIGIKEVEKADQLELEKLRAKKQKEVATDSIEKEVSKPLHWYAMETRMKDLSMIGNSLDNLGCLYQSIDDLIAFRWREKDCFLRQNEAGLYEAIFNDLVTVEVAQKIVAEVQEEYTKVLQAQVYTKLLAKAEERGLILESEEIEADNSVLLTFSVQGR
ncbi:hypothetical protein F9B85_08500 [Heliorestis acidaminivorans]|uniref:Uncharacterized protein n=1 Tax=Heliorestis acidaminivorans TaxID=553427 RepID=A0A6I0F2I7_9FIRM|nr:hypothetical protein [Heliorestis acidaminivorans]KAB2952683.1 hypothetical protein F9B85_08500 [Heliorestis acidaminivorans]